MSDDAWDLVVVGGGPAGAATALGALAARPDLRVLVVDRADFPRDKPCGDGVAPHVLDVLAEVGVHGILDDLVPVRRLALRTDRGGVERRMARPAYVVPRTVLDERLVRAAVDRGAVLRRHRVRDVQVDADGVVLDGTLRARVLVGADGAHSVVRGAAGLRPHRRRALALRGYAPVADARRGLQEIVFGDDRQPSYAWSFDRGDGLANVGYGELLFSRRAAPSRSLLLEQMERLLPGTASVGDDFRAHHLPLSGWGWRPTSGRVLLVGDAAGLINPLTGEGIYYAVLTGVLAGRAAAHGDAAGAGERHRAAVQPLLRAHLAGTAAASRLAALPFVVPRAVSAARRDQRAFDELVEVGLGRGLLTPHLLTALARG
ncbi:NAD(P)/FAD-dependent oxidoreductase [Solicola sp. PLA-1-18]|uniref:NAD(P)/FAD-dependent oxidoreductase n=1 Tax=Solicola sp. PLA-1-18 TaxID=3380532 RepID=UPI003B7BA064